MRATVGDELDYTYIERWLNELNLSNEWALAKQLRSPSQLLRLIISAQSGLLTARGGT